MASIQTQKQAKHEYRKRSERAQTQVKDEYYLSYKVHLMSQQCHATHGSIPTGMVSTINMPSMPCKKTGSTELHNTEASKPDKSLLALSLC